MHKPFTTIDDQIALLNSRGLQTDSRTSWILEREGYYATVNGYKKPFLDNQARKKDEEDKYREGSLYNDLYKLYLFDRQLRFLLFGMITIAEAILKTVCAYEFTKANPAEKNPYLNIDNYARTGQAHEKASQLIPRLQKILTDNSDCERKGRKEYLVHCLNEHDGEVPLWVLTNDLTLGQIYWFFQSQNILIRGSIARSFTVLYGDSHRHKTEIDAQRIDKIYRRMKDFRNICAHDERLYCAHPHDSNNTVFQLVKDLRFVIDKKRYLEFLQQFNSLLMHLGEDIPAYVDSVYREMGLDFPRELHEWMELARTS